MQHLKSLAVLLGLLKLLATGWPGVLLRMDDLWLLIRNRNFVLVSHMYLPSPLKHLLHDVKYTTLDELHENDPGLTIDVVPGSVRRGLVSIKLHIWHPLSSHFEF